MKKTTNLRKYRFISGISLIFFAFNLYAAKAFVIFGSPILFALTLIFEAILVGLFTYSFLRAMATPKRIVESLFKSMWEGLESNEYVKPLVESRTPVLAWVKRRLTRNNPYGLPLSITLVVSSFFLINFLNLLTAVVSNGSLTHVDTRILNLVPSLRTSVQTSFFQVVTALANKETAIFLVVLTALVLFRNHQRVLSYLVICIAGSEEVVTFVVKLLVRRPRPNQALSLISEDSFSFPSGHVVRATVLFGFFAYILYKKYSSTRGRILIVAIYVLAVFSVALSRIYLGVHYPTDVWGSVLLGSAILTLPIGVLEISKRFELAGHRELGLTNKSLLAIPVALLIFVAFTSHSIAGVRQITQTPKVTVLLTIDHSTLLKLPLYSQTLTGSRMEPINFIYVASKDQILEAFGSHGWYRADPSTLSNTLKALAVGFQSRQYLTAPVTPSYLNFKPEDLAFEQSTAMHSLKQRHHTRLWKTDFVTSGGVPIWVATASFDEGVEFVGPARLPTHHIDPNIDRERSYIINSLGLKENLLSVVPPQLGKNAGGDGFFTDGKAELVTLD